MNELLERGCWWWVFVPLARDCNVAGIERAVLALREHVPHDLMRGELLAAMRLFAERREQHSAVTGWSEIIRREVETMSSSSSNWMAELPFGKELIAQAEARAEARTKARVQRADLLELYELRLGRPMTEDEQATFDARLEADGRTRLARVVLDLDADGLAAWLAEHAA